MTKQSSKTQSMKISIPEVKNALKTYDKDSLVSIILDCYKQSQEVKNYIHVLMNPDTAIEVLYLSAKNQILHEFFPDRGFGKLRFSIARKAITEFKKLSNDEQKTIDLMIYYVELGVEFANTYGDVHEKFYDSMISMYGNVIKKVKGNIALQKQFDARLVAIVNESNGTGWGFYECLGDVYGELILEVDEE